MFNHANRAKRALQIEDELPEVELVGQNDTVETTTEEPALRDGVPPPTNSSAVIVQDPTTTLAVVNPAIGETLFVGATVLIRWTSSIILTTAHIELSDSTVIADNVNVGSTDGQYYWLIKEPPGTYTVLVRGFQVASSVAIEDWSDTFTIEDQYSLHVIKPSKNQIIVRGEAATIT